VLEGSVSLQGRPAAPDASWVTDLVVSLTRSGESTLRYTFTPTTSDSGAFTLSGINPDTYQVRVKGRHTLQNMGMVSLSSGSNSVNLGQLREGDANDDNMITLLDFSLLAAKFGACSGYPNYDPMCDFNADGCTTIIDYSLLAGNFGQVGDIDTQSPSTEIEALSGEIAVLSAIASKSEVTVGATFDVILQVDTRDQHVDGVAAYLNFDPVILEVVSITAGDNLPVVITNDYQNQEGHINYAAGLLGSSTTGAFTLTTVTFRTIAATGETWLDFGMDMPRKSEVTFQGMSVLDYAEGCTMVIIGDAPMYEPRSHLPLLMR